MGVRLKLLPVNMFIVNLGVVVNLVIYNYPNEGSVGDLLIKDDLVLSINGETVIVVSDSVLSEAAGFVIIKNSGGDKDVVSVVVSIFKISLVSIC